MKEQQTAVRKTLPAEEAPQSVRFRPTLVAGLGGAGHRMAVSVLGRAAQYYGDEIVRQYFRFLVFDTAQESLKVSIGGRTVALEPGTEFIDIGQTPVPRIKRNLRYQDAIRERLGDVMSNLPPVVLRNGAKQLRPLGLLALLWRFPEVESHLQHALWELASRQSDDERQGIDIFILNSLTGGTGSSIFLDIGYLVQELVDDLGSLSDFCHTTGVGILPRAFHGITGPNLVPNCVAALKELNHCMMRGGFAARYPTGRTITTNRPPFDVYYLVDGVDERGHTWPNLGEVCDLAAEAIFLLIGSRIGEKQKSDFDNLDDVLAGQTDAGDGTFYGSFGLASLVFSGVDAAKQCAARQAVRLIDSHLLSASAPAAAEGQADPVADFARRLSLDPAQLMERLACDEQELPIPIEIVTPDWVGRLPLQSVPAEVIRYVNDYEQLRLETDFKRLLAANVKSMLSRLSDELAAGLRRLCLVDGLPSAGAGLARLGGTLEETLSQLSQRRRDLERKLTSLSQEVLQREVALVQAVDGGFFGRTRRLSQAQQAYLTAAQQKLKLSWRVQVMGAACAVLENMWQGVKTQESVCQQVMERLIGARYSLEQTAWPAANGNTDATPGWDHKNGAATRNLLDETVMSNLYQRFAPPEGHLLTSLFSNGQSPLTWADRSPQEIAFSLLDACLPPFLPLAEMGVEDAISAKVTDSSKEGYFRWLMSQAAPSWNLDRTRLADGGCGMRELRILGVPDESASIFRERSGLLASTGDRTRLTAFTARLGAPHTAVQQWDVYLSAYERARTRTPLHVLPQFLASNQRGRQAFALGALFGFIVNQGSHFYYQPADPLQRLQRIAQGLANAASTFTQNEQLVRETWERVEKAVAAQGVDATLQMLDSTYHRGNGDDSADELVLEMKRLVRDYADELRQIHQLAPGGSSGAAVRGTDHED